MFFNCENEAKVIPDCNELVHSFPDEYFEWVIFSSKWYDSLITITGTILWHPSITHIIRSHWRIVWKSIFYQCNCLGDFFFEVDLGNNGKNPVFFIIKKVNRKRRVNYCDHFSNIQKNHVNSNCRNIGLSKNVLNVSRETFWAIFFEIISLELSRKFFIYPNLFPWCETLCNFTSISWNHSTTWTNHKHFTWNGNLIDWPINL